jgi:hypothetical protein
VCRFIQTNSTQVQTCTNDVRLLLCHKISSRLSQKL